MSAQSLFEKVWASHIVAPETDDTPAVLYVDLHLIHEVTSPQAFDVPLARPQSAPDRPLPRDARSLDADGAR
jgi:3-isopropylmalate/(R)-2-methylmalate dehydratase large subunit